MKFINYIKKRAAILFVSLTFVFALCISSCEEMMGDYLEKAPGTDVTEDTIFSSAKQLETFFYSIYQYGMHSNLPYYFDGTAAHYKYAAESVTLASSSISDETEQAARWYWPHQWNAGIITANSNQEEVDYRWPYRWLTMRKISVLLDRVDEVPDITPQYAAQLKAEVKAIRAMNYFEMLKRYGGVPIIDHRLSLVEDPKIPRSTLEKVINFILKDCEEAYPDLPIHQLGSLRGRMHKGVALAVKAKTLLFAASPQFNTATPYLDLGENNPLICLGDSKKERWDDAAKACKAVLDWAQETGYCKLIDDKGVDENYKYTWDVYDNEEIIFAEKTQTFRWQYTWPWGGLAPAHSIYRASSGESGASPTLNFVKKYEKKDGTRQTWEGGNDLQAKMAALDRRFDASIIGHRGIWDKNGGDFSDPLELQQEDPANNIKEGVHLYHCFGGFWMRKLYPTSLNGSKQLAPNSTLYQLNEFYLAYAEAMNEMYGPDDSRYGLTARQAVNKIRARSGQPEITTGSGIYADFKELIRNEWAIEMAFDDHRFWDIRRWMIAEQEGVMQGDMWGIQIYKIPGDDTEDRYEPYVFEQRTWHRKYYLHPFRQVEIDKGYLVQNPDY
jgi:hypothetical protein